MFYFLIDTKQPYWGIYLEIMVQDYKHSRYVTAIHVTTIACVSSYRKLIEVTHSCAPLGDIVALNQRQ